MCELFSPTVLSDKYVNVLKNTRRILDENKALNNSISIFFGAKCLKDAKKSTISYLYC